MAATLLMLPPQTPTTRDWAKRLAVALPGLSVIVTEDEGAVERAVGQAEAAYGTMPREFLEKAARLRWIQAPQAAPPAGWYYPELIAHPAVVTNFREIYNDHIGAHIMAFLLAFARRRHAPPGMVELHGAEALDSLLPRADFVILTVPHTPATEGFMHRARFQRMKRSAFFINIGRGMTTRLDDLVSALSAGEIAGAGLDVFEQEPLPAKHPLWTMPGALSTPHTAGHGPHLDERRFEILLDNSRRFLADLPLRNVVDKANWF